MAAQRQLSREYDALFRRHGGSIPVAYLRALAWRESSMNPRNASGPAWGLMQVVEVVRNSYNSRHGASYSRQDLLDPEINVKVGVETMRRILSNYKRFHPDVRNLREDWSNPEFVKIFTAGWNSGYSEAGGVGRVAKYLKARGIPVTHDNVFAHAGAAGATRHLQAAQRLNWQRSVADLYFQQPDAPIRGGAGSFLAKVGITVLVGYAVYRLTA